MLFVNYQTESAAPSASAPFTAPSAPLVASASSFTSQAPAAAAAFPSPSAPSIGLSKVEEEQGPLRAVLNNERVGCRELRRDIPSPSSPPLLLSLFSLRPSQSTNTIARRRA